MRRFEQTKTPGRLHAVQFYPIPVRKSAKSHNFARLLHQRSHADDVTFADGFGQSHQQLFLLSSRLTVATLTALLGTKSWHCYQ